MRKYLSNQRGQAIVEYMIIVSAALMVFIALSMGLKTPIKRLWIYFTKNIAAACPGCPYSGQ